MADMLYGVIYGALGGALSSASFIFKNSAKNKEKLDLKKAIISIAVAGIVGAISTFGISADIINTGAIGSFIGILIENSAKGINRRTKKNKI